MTSVAERARPAVRRAARHAEALLGSVLQTAAVRRRLTGRAARAWRQTDAPLIVCLGNINRSPFAAAVARERQGSRARSAGFLADVGRPSPPATVAAAAGHGIDLSDHRSAVVDRAMLTDAAAVFVFDLENVLRLALLAPAALRRTHLLGALAAEGDVVISDPHGEDPAVLQAVLARIHAVVVDADRER